jgi:hypothetical protein
MTRSGIVTLQGRQIQELTTDLCVIGMMSFLFLTSSFFTLVFDCFLIAQ